MIIVTNCNTLVGLALREYYEGNKRESLRDICHRIATRYNVTPSYLYGIAYAEMTEMNQ